MHQNKNDTTGHGLILDDHFRRVAHIDAEFLSDGMNMHELSLMESPRGISAIHLTSRLHIDDLRSLNITRTQRGRGWIADTGFREIDVSSGTTLFQWWPRDHLPLTHRTVPVNEHAFNRPPYGWDWL